MKDIREAQFVLKGGKAIHPPVEQDGLEMYLDTKGKKNTDRHNNTLLDMSGNNRHGELHNFTYKNQSGYTEESGLVFDGIDDTLKMPKLSGIDENNFTYQLNNNILAFNGDEVKTVKNGDVEVIGRNLLLDSSFRNSENLPFRFSTIHSNLEIIGDHVVHTIKADSQSVRFQIDLEMEEVGKYTYSFMANLPYNPYWRGHVGVSNFEIIKTGTVNEDSLYIVSFEVNSPGTVLLRAYMSQLRKGDNLYFKWEKLEKSNKATDWIPAPEDLLEMTELKGNILGDMEDVVDTETRDQQSGTEIYTDKADDSAVHVEVDGKSIGGEQGEVYVSNEETYVLRAHHNTDDYPLSTGNLQELSGKVLELSFEARVISGNPTETLALYFRGSSPTYYFGTQEVIPDWRKYTVLFQVPDGTAAHSHLSFHTAMPSKGGTVFDGEVRNVVLEDQHTPTPDYPIEIHSLNDFDVVSSVGGRNLLLNSGKAEALRISSNNGYTSPIETGVENGVDWITGISLDDNAFFISAYITQTYDAAMGTRYSEELKSYEGLLTFSVEVMPEYPLAVYMVGASDERFELEPGEWTRISITQNKSSRPIWFRGIHDPEVPLGTKIFWRKYKIEKGTVPTDWTPAPEDITENDNHPLFDKINLSLSEPLRSVGDVKDRLFRDSDGLWKVERNLGEITLDGSREYRIAVNKNPEYSSYHFPDNDIAVRAKITSSHYPFFEHSGPYKSKEGQRISNYIDTSASIMITDYTMTHEQFQNKLRDSPVTVVYEKRNSVIETLSQKVQDKLNNLRSFQDSNYVFTVLNNKTDNLSPVIQGSLKPTLHSTFQAKDYLKESRTVNNLLMWDRPLNDDELLHQNRLFHRRFNFRSDTIKGEPVVWNLDLLNGGVYAHSLEQNYTIEI